MTGDYAARGDQPAETNRPWATNVMSLRRTGGLCAIAHACSYMNGQVTRVGTVPGRAMPVVVHSLMRSHQSPGIRS